MKSIRRLYVCSVSKTIALLYHCWHYVSLSVLVGKIGGVPPQSPMIMQSKCDNGLVVPLAVVDTAPKNTKDDTTGKRIRAGCLH